MLTLKISYRRIFFGIQPCITVHSMMFMIGHFAHSLASNMFCQLSALLSDIGLNIREAHVFSTHDGYSLDVFVVDGWPIEVTS